MRANDAHGMQGTGTQMGRLMFDSTLLCRQRRTGWKPRMVGLLRLLRWGQATCELHKQGRFTRRLAPQRKHGTGSPCHLADFLGGGSYMDDVLEGETLSGKAD
jgi:hypothetical protein